MFDALSDRLRDALSKLSGRGRITEADVDAAMREVRLDVLEGINPGQAVIKIVNDELTEVLGAGDRTFRLNGQPAVVVMAGLQGSGKTTSSAKLARYIVRQGRQPLLVAADPYRPAAVDQLITLGGVVAVPVFKAPPGTPVVDICRDAVAEARRT